LDSYELARSNVRQAEDRLTTARIALERGNYPYAVRQAQECVELSLKACLRLVGIEPPKWHDVGPIIRRERENFPEWFKEHVERIVSISRSLRKERELAMYGDEESKIPPEGALHKIRRGKSNRRCGVCAGDRKKVAQGVRVRSKQQRRHHIAEPLSGLS
jgi:HEPN domain-containing protein